MKHLSIDRPQDFEFHDAEWSCICHDAQTLVMETRHLNVRQVAEQNDCDCDMEIDLARMTFRGFRVISYEPGRCWRIDPFGHKYPEGPQIILEHEEALAAFLKELENIVTIYSFTQDGEGEYTLDGMGEEPFFTLHFRCDEMMIEWDDHSCPAWYVPHHRGQKA